MAKQRLVMGLALLSIAVEFAIAQSAIRGNRPIQKPIFNEQTKAVIIHGFSKDQIWAAALSVAKAEKMNIVKTSQSYIFALQTTGSRVEVDIAIIDHPKIDSLRPWAPAVVLGIDIPEFGELSDFRSMNAEQRTFLSRQLTMKVIDILYSPPAK